MTKPLNIYALSRIREEQPFNIVEKHHSQTTGARRTQRHEMLSLRRLADALMMPENGLNISALDGFFFSYQIPHVGKEFDLLKLAGRTCLNIELKSEQVPEDQILRQLQRNRYYLSHLGKHLHLYTVVTDSLTCYRLAEDGSALLAADIPEIAAAIGKMHVPYLTDIDDLFRASDYLISPSETPERFIRGEYFLTQAQERVRELILESLSEAPADASGAFLHITGKPGTGKTLLLYDLARTLSEVGRTLIIHCGHLTDGQKTISREMAMLDIVSSAQLGDDAAEALADYHFILVDESHRMQPRTFEALCDSIKKDDRVCLFSSDPEQALTTADRKNAIVDRIRRLPLRGEYVLSEKIRGSRELQTFIMCLRDLSHREDPLAAEFTYPNVELNYANTTQEAQELLALYRRREYTFINYAENDYPYEDFEEDFDTERIIGREFDNVVMLMDDSFYYDETGKLHGAPQPDPDILYPNLFYQGMTRVRERLALIVVDAPELFDKIVSIVK